MIFHFQCGFLFWTGMDLHKRVKCGIICISEVEKGYGEISLGLKLILFGASIDDEMAISDKVVKIQFSVGAGVTLA